MLQIKTIQLSMEVYLLKMRKGMSFFSTKVRNGVSFFKIERYIVISQNLKRNCCNLSYFIMCLKCLFLTKIPIRKKIKK